ncbi:GIY-YIG nuclease family protein [Rubrolithibacter danxiaensis]|uniref:GIY-YIG nuclease family protein n=1 Tax=Rubrolithibacter danxiaensis TaxID=3390805 RepID=UPI003BF8FF88
MKKYVFIITDCNRSTLQVGTSSDLLGTMKFYRKMPHLVFDSTQQFTRLVYFEELNSEEAVRQRFNVISKFTRAQKEKLIRSVNPDWVDLTVGLDFEQIILNGNVPSTISLLPVR